VHLIEHQLVLGRCLQASGDSDPSTLLAADSVQVLPSGRQELAELGALVTSPGFRFTRRIQRSWCIARTAAAAQLTLSLLPVEQRGRLIDDWVDVGGGRGLDPASDAESFLEFVTQHLRDPSHALSVCRMEQAAYRASEAALQFRPPNSSLLDDSKAMLRAGKGAALVRFFAEPQRLFAAIEAKEPLPPLSERPSSVLFAPGLPQLYRPANNDEEKVWEMLSGSPAVPVLSLDPGSRHAIDGLFRIGAVELAGSSGARHQ
jgi:hypothetical protein